MKHILNNLSEQEKNSIREQHTGGIKIINENFSKLLNSKLGDSKPLVSEQAATAVVQKPVAMTDRVKQLVGFLQNGKYTSSEIQQAQNIIKNPPATRAPQQSPVVVSQKSQQQSQQNQPASNNVSQPVAKAGSATAGYGGGR